MRLHPRLVDVRRNRSGADPFVNAPASLHGLTVVTDERPARSTQHPPQIPDVCQAMNVPGLGVFDFARRCGLAVLRH